jgi:hypothetical protein
MRRENVPQDDDNLFDGVGTEVCYAVGEDGRYVQVPSVGWEPKNLANRQAWDLIESQVRVACEAVAAGKASPLLVQMTRAMMDPGLLASYAGIAAWRVRRHLRPGPFARLPRHLKERYARIFDTTVEGLCRVDPSRQGEGR